MIDEAEGGSKTEWWVVGCEVSTYRTVSQAKTKKRIQKQLEIHTTVRHRHESAARTVRTYR